MKKNNTIKAFFIFSVFSTLACLLLIKANNVLNSTDTTDKYKKYICINEVVTDNVTGITDEDGDHSDWIELYNPNSYDINLANYGLTDDADTPDKWLFPNVSIHAKSYLVVFVSGKNKCISSDYIHTNFKLSNKGDVLYLYDINGKEVDSISIPDNLNTNYSYGYAINKNYKYCSFTCATPGKANIAQTYKIYSDVQPLGNVNFSFDSGYYKNSFLLTLSSENDKAKIVYTVDGSEPNENSPIYQQPILVTQNLNPNNNIRISTKVNVNSQPEIVYKPKSDTKGVVIRARLIQENCLSDSIETKTYFFNPNYNLPIISLSCNNKDMFSYKEGLYVPGLFFDVWKKYNPEVYDNWFPIANYSQDREIPGSIEYFSNEGKMLYQQNIGIKISGNASRNNACKALKITAKKKYSNTTRLDFDFLDGTAHNFKGKKITNFKNIVLRNSGNDFNKTMFLDAFIQKIALEHTPEISPQAYCPVIVFINGEYWGIHNIREVHDEYYIESHYNINHKNVEMYHSFNEIFLSDKQMSLGQYILSNNMSDTSVYKYVSSKIDIDNLIKYLAFEIYIANTDWPTGNLLMWKSTSSNDDNSYEDKKIRMILYDVDCAFSNYEEDSLKKFFEISTNDDISNTSVIGALLKNKTIQDKFIAEINNLQNNVFKSDTVGKEIDLAATKIDADIIGHFERWNYSNIIHTAYLAYKKKSDPPAYNIWLENVSNLKTFAINRPKYIQQYISDYFNK